jgi:acyl carrier protein
MGLDSVEIIMEVEKTFGISIPDKEAEKIITVGDFHEAVWKHLNGKLSDKCKSQVLFYRLRQSFTDTFDFPKQHLKMDSSLNEIFPELNRRKLYVDFAESNQLKFSPLVLKEPWSGILAWFGFITIVGGLMLALILINFLDYTKWTLLIPSAGILFTILLSELFTPKRTVIKPATIRDFTRQIVAMNYATLVDINGSNRKEVASVINHIIALKVGIDLEEITPEKKICDDLGID